MEQWFRGKILKPDRVGEKDQTYKDSKAEFISYRYRGDSKGYGDTVIKIALGKDGSISFSDEHSDSGFVYLYPEQVKHLKRILGIKNFRNIRGTLGHSQRAVLSK